MEEWKRQVENQIVRPLISCGATARENPLIVSSPRHLFSGHLNPLFRKGTPYNLIIWESPPQIPSPDPSSGRPGPPEVYVIFFCWRWGGARWMSRPFETASSLL